MSGSGTAMSPYQPELTYKACTGTSDTSCLHGDACRQDCDGHSGEWICCNPTTKAVTEDQQISCPTLNVPCGELKTHYLWNPADPKCTAGVATNGALYPLWTRLYNMPILPWTGFNNTVLTGGLVTGLALLFPVYLAGRRFGVMYNDRFKEKIMNSRIVKGLKASWLFDWYFKAGV